MNKVQETNQGGELYMVLLVKVCLLGFGVNQTSQTARQWCAIGFVSSLHRNLRANLILYIASMVDMFCTVIFTFNLFYLILAEAQPLQVRGPPSRAASLPV